MDPIKPPDVALVTTAVCTLTRHTLSLTQLVEQMGEALPILSQQIVTLQTAILDLLDVVEGLRRRVDQLAPPLGRVQ